MSVYIIAEAGVNHNGDIDRAMTMVDTAAAAGADAVKFQTFQAEILASAAAMKAPYQAVQTGEAGGQIAMLKALELSHAAHVMLRDHCRTCDIAFLSTPFDLGSLRFLVDEIGVETIKLGSSEVTNGPMLVAAGRSGRRIILSTGMSTLDEVRIALGGLAFGALELSGRPDVDEFRALASDTAARHMLAGRVTLLQCTTAYPAPSSEANLRAMAVMSQEFGLPCGYSDHTPGSTAAIAAVALGAVMLEKHFTMSRALPGPDHSASLEPAELKALVTAVREVESALGDGIKQRTPGEEVNAPHARRSLVAARHIRRGERFDETSLTTKRPGTGLSPMAYWSWLGRIAERDYEKDELIGP